MLQTKTLFSAAFIVHMSRFVSLTRFVCVISFLVSEFKKSFICLRNCLQVFNVSQNLISIKAAHYSSSEAFAISGHCAEFYFAFLFCGAYLACGPVQPRMALLVPLALALTIWCCSLDCR